MNKSEEYGTLVIFTALSPLAVGGLFGLLVTPVTKSNPGTDWAAMTVLSTGALALVISLLHLGRPWRAPLALRRFNSSWLSREVILFGVFLVLLGFYGIMPAIIQDSLVLHLFGFTAAISGLAATVATGETYRLRARPSWDHWVSVSSFPLGALSAGCLFGFFVARQFSGHNTVPCIAWAVTALFLLSAAVVTWVRSTRRRPDSEEGSLSRKYVFKSFIWLLVLRGAATIVALMMIGSGNGMQFLAWIPALVGEFSDRYLFFMTAIPVTLRGRYLGIEEAR